MELSELIMTHQTLLVTGASGKLGRKTIDFLLEAGQPAEKIIATTRNVSGLGDLAEKGVLVRHADFNQPQTLENAFAGADRLALISTDAIDPGSDRVAQHTAAVKAAAASGVKHIVYTSLPFPDTSRISFAADHFGSEKAIFESGLAYTILRNSWYQENLLGGLPQAFAQGALTTAAGDGRQTFIAHEDCARALAAALMAETSGSAIYTLTGSDAHTVDELAAMASEAAGKPLSVRQVSEETLRSELNTAGLPPFVVELMVSVDANIREGGFSETTDDYEKLTDRKPKRIETFFAENKTAF